MPYCGNQPLRPLSLPEWLVLCIVCEKPTPGFAVTRLLSQEGSLGRIWHVSQPAIYRAMRQLTRLGFVQMARQPGAGSLAGHSDPNRPRGCAGVAAQTRHAWR